MALAVAINLRGWSSATNAITLVGLWVAVTLVTPALLAAYVETVHPMPSRALLTQEARQMGNDAEREGSRVLAEYFENHPELMAEGLKVDWANAAQRYYGVRGEVMRRIEPALRDFDMRRVARERLINRYRILSPASVVQEAIEEIAGTRGSRYRRFRTQVEQYQREWHNFFVARMFRGMTTTARTELDVDLVPRFHWSEQPISDMTRRVSMLWLTLVSMLGIALLTVWVAARHTRLN
jgi:ABC-2 type transport system permease protein